MIKAIETKYKGYRFRSRLEARWAVFFDAMGYKWEYEPEGFDLDGVYYLPDFRIAEKDSNGDFNVFWFEVKPDDAKLSNDDILKIKKFAIDCHAGKSGLTKGYGDFIILDGPPGKKSYLCANEFLSIGIDEEPRRWAMDLDYRCGRPTFQWRGCSYIDDRYLSYLEIHDGFGSSCNYLQEHPVDVARAARFEHGECG